MYIAIICFPVDDVMNFKINLNFFIKLLFYITKKSGQEFKYFKNERVFQVKKKILYIFFKGFPVTRN